MPMHPGVESMAPVAPGLRNRPVLIVCNKHRGRIAKRRQTVIVLPTRRYLSPLRYPGGKAALAPFLSQVLAGNSLLRCSYYEPFAGGAGAALRLLQDGDVSTLHLNDADSRIYMLWRAVFDENERFADAVEKATPSIREWHEHYRVYTSPKRHTAFEIAYSTFFLNRCNRSGVIQGSRPIGGMDQQGPFKIDARFNTKTLAERIRILAQFKGSVRLYNQDALVFLKEHLPQGKRRSNVFVYLDPPYYSKGSRLYLNYYSGAEHKALATYMLKQRQLPWVMSYDDQAAIRKLYGCLVRTRIGVDYSLQMRRRSKELVIAPLRVKLPSRRASSHA